MDVTSHDSSIKIRQCKTMIIMKPNFKAIMKFLLVYRKKTRTTKRRACQRLRRRKNRRPHQRKAAPLEVGEAKQPPRAERTSQEVSRKAAAREGNLPTIMRRLPCRTQPTSVLLRPITLVRRQLRRLQEKGMDRRWGDRRRYCQHHRQQLRYYRTLPL